MSSQYCTSAAGARGKFWAGRARAVLAFGVTPISLAEIAENKRDYVVGMGSHFIRHMRDDNFRRSDSNVRWLLHNVQVPSTVQAMFQIECQNDDQRHHDQRRHFNATTCPDVEMPCGKAEDLRECSVACSQHQTHQK